ncbi:MAG: thiosulfate sulfurtransferase [Candidatus Omnitrophica bacterium]|nr:thiosulfate sulfurtransferase [Candidatus Omnitrophota bacterium]
MGINSDIPQISPEEAMELMNASDVSIVDIRDSNSFQEAHIKDAMQLSQGNLESFLDSADKFKTLICYCYHGISSIEAAHFLKSKGFADVRSLRGGFEAWRKSFPNTTE